MPSCPRWRPRCGTSGVEAVAVCLLHAYAHPAHEARLRAALEGHVPFVSVSHEINAEFREYERTSTTALNAAVMPIADRYLADLEASLARAGVRATLHLLQSSGAMMSAAVARRRPLAMAISGPAGGVAASRFLARAAGLRNAIAFDMGGTTTDVCLIADGRAESLSQRRLGGHPVRLPSVGVESIGAGGGSLARADGAALRVGPDSAGARPGPACYGLGGTAPTVTDAHAVGGHAPGRRPPGRGHPRRRRPRPRGARAGRAALGLGFPRRRRAMLEVANAAMRRAIRLISVQRGRDLRDFTLIAYGGAGPLHAGRLAQELGMPRVVVPAHAGRLLGAGLPGGRGGLRPRPDLPAAARRADRGRARRPVRAARRRRCARRCLPRATGRSHRAAGSVDVRYVGQNYELEVPWTGDLDGLRASFHALHRRLYAYATEDAVECVNLRIRAGVEAEAARLPEWPAAGSGQPFAEHEAYFPETGPTALPVYRRADLPPEHPVKGPALIEDPWATTLVYPGQTGLLDRAGNLWMGADVDLPTLRRARVTPAMSGSPGLNPVTLEVVRHAIYAIAEEMSLIIMRSARSPLLKEAGDLSSALTDARGRLIAQGRDIPIHLGVMGFTVKEFLRRVPRRELRDGDVWYLNLPEVGGNHLPDVKAIRPVFAGGRLVAFAINLAHWADIGGAVPGSYVPWADEAIQEGLRIAPIKVFDRKGPTRALDLIMANLRGRDEREGDCRAMYSAVEIGARRLGELFDRYGPPTILGCFDRYRAESEAHMRAAIREIPDGVYAGEDWVDDDGHEDRPVPVRVTVTVRGGRAAFDFTGTGPAVKGPVNATPYVTCSAVYYSMKSLVAPDVPANDGCYRPITVHIPPDTILSPPPTAPVVGGNHETSQRVVDACYKALAQAIPERITAGGPTTAGLLIFGTAPGRAVAHPLRGPRGRGGRGRRAGRRPRHAGPHVERHEHAGRGGGDRVPGGDPCQALRPGSGGAGAHRGGCGFTRAYRVLTDATLTTMLERRVVPPWGAFGGEAGAPTASRSSATGRPRT